MLGVMTNLADTPEGIGPHEGRELDLMLAGEKPVAMFGDIIPSDYEWPDEKFEPYVKSGQLCKEEYFTRTADGKYRVRNLYYALPHETWRIAQLHAFATAYFDTLCKESLENSTRIGRLLGYSEEQISIFIKWVCR